MALLALDLYYDINNLGGLEGPESCAVGK